MVRVSIISLIYQSARLADWVHASVMKFTPMIARGEADFFFVANDPTSALLSHLDSRAYPYMVNLNTKYSDAELFGLGYAKPEYMSRVYRGYNAGVRSARADYVVLINSDNYFSPDWLENLLKYSDRRKVITSTLIERSHPVFGVFPGAVHGEFGGDPDSFDEAGFLDFVSRTKQTGIVPGGAYMPALFHRDVAIEAGLYPTGNVAGTSYEDVSRYGDEAFFDRLESLGVSHFTALDSISYHLKEGEREDGPGGVHDTYADAVPAPKLTPADALPITASVASIRDPMPPTKRHQVLMASLAGEASGEPSSSIRQRFLRALRVGTPEARPRTIKAANSREASRQEAEETALARQGDALRRLVRRLFGERRAPTVLAAIHSVSWVTRPIRRALISRAPRRRG